MRSEIENRILAQFHVLLLKQLETESNGTEPCALRDKFAKWMCTMEFHQEVPALETKQSNQGESSGSGLFTLHESGPLLFVVPSSALLTLQLGTISPGDIVTAYRGVVIEPTDLPLIYALQPHLLVDNEYILTRYDECLVDGSPAAASRKVYSGLNAASVSETAILHLGSFINHSPSQENVIPIGVGTRPPRSFDSHCVGFTHPITSDLHRHDSLDAPSWRLLQTILPARPFKSSASSSAPSKQVVFIATRELRPGEEILFNYNYSTASGSKPAPLWYQMDTK